VPFVASEKKVEAWVVSVLRENVYDDWNDTPVLEARRTSTMSASYQDRPSLVLSSIAEKLAFGRAAVTGWKSVPSGSVSGTGTFTSPLRHRFRPRVPAYPTVTTTRPGSSRWRLRFHTWTRGSSMSYWIGRMERAPRREKSGTGKVGLGITGRGVAGGLVTVTIRFWWLMVLK